MRKLLKPAVRIYFLPRKMFSKALREHRWFVRTQKHTQRDRDISFEPTAFFQLKINFEGIFVFSFWCGKRYKFYVWLHKMWYTITEDFFILLRSQRHLTTVDCENKRTSFGSLVSKFRFLPSKCHGTKESNWSRLLCRLKAPKWYLVDDACNFLLSNSRYRIRSSRTHRAHKNPEKILNFISKPWLCC